MLTSRATLLGVVLSTAGLLPAASGQDTCYYPNGDVAEGDIPCFADTEFSACCADGYKCMSNGMCQRGSLDEDKDLLFDRGSCTDQDWDSDDCPQFCLDRQRGGGHSMLRCAENRDRFVCIWEDKDYRPQCEKDGNYYEFDEEVTVATTITVSSSTSEPTETTESEVSSTSTTTEDEATSTGSVNGSEASSTATTTESAASTSTAGAGQQESSAAPADEEEEDNNNEEEDDSSSSSSNSGLIGGAIGGSLGGICLGGAVVWFLLRHRGKNQRQSNMNELPGDHEMPGSRYGSTRQLGAGAKPEWNQYSPEGYSPNNYSAEGWQTQGHNGHLNPHWPQELEGATPRSEMNG